VPLLHLRRTVKLSVGGPNSTVESLPPSIRNIHTSTNREVSDHCTGLSCYQTIIDTANRLNAHQLDDETVHRHGPPDALVPKDWIWCWLYAHFEPSSKFTGSNKFFRMLEMDETGKLKHQCWERLINLIVKCVGANKYDMCRFRALFLSSIGTGNRLCITCPSDSHSNNKKRPHFEALCDETYGASREMYHSLMAETSVMAIGVFRVKPYKVFLSGEHKALNSSIISKEVQNQCDVVQEGPIPHMERQNNLLTKKEQLKLGDWIERLLRFALNDPKLVVTEEMLDKFVPCTSDEKRREGMMKNVISLETDGGINKATSMVQKVSGVSSELAEEIVESRRSSGATKISQQIVAGSMRGAKRSAAAAARYDQETGKFYCNACGRLPSTCDGESFGNGRYNRPHLNCPEKPRGHFCLTKVSEEVKVDILQRAYCLYCSQTGLLNGRHDCSGNGGGEESYTSLTAPSNFDVNDMGKSYTMVMKFEKVEGCEELVAVDSWRGIGMKSKSSGKTCLEDVVQTAKDVKTDTLKTKSDLLSSLDKSNRWAFVGNRKKIVVRAASRHLQDYMTREIVGENNLHDEELRLGNYIYRGVKVVPPSQE